ncbi:helix-turn-helix domain-containing protein [Nocardioides KLBMP 9356]|uniref:Helix-turn-helix domain-containing protein n=1 Tax=Nocardioides potassii TaxID=2911371 RepID=A0ABS9HAD5_9ACTN|nr:helix-turn-helix transcriptional regulator [Nocardioides potassii]MCF6378180.1 helix-turn-helix domain-containing protein [Nocardioides potassii]
MPAPPLKPPISDAAGEFGRRVRARRLELEMSQEDLAESSELHWSYLGQVERGQNNLTLHNILKVAAALDMDPGRLMKGLTPPPSQPDAPARRSRVKGPRRRST